jgi:hypothetical protein
VLLTSIGALPQTKGGQNREFRKQNNTGQAGNKRLPPTKSRVTAGFSVKQAVEGIVQTGKREKVMRTIKEKEIEKSLRYVLVLGSVPKNIYIRS